ncbi:putative cystinosin [Trypanosoma grayi]|uniref:putative cystinosin n=1 Tax=Trypanosoma grayi TaxID=71804 RepID=UPI0004F4B411|nr:putative cystinosin [Trypanosoma grayi]KEG08328.1 putative cystinosin [Trypanosoma grayi]
MSADQQPGEPCAPPDGTTHVLVEPFDDAPHTNSGVSGGGDMTPSDEKDPGEAPRVLADPSGIKIGKYEIPSGVVAMVSTVLMAGAAVLLTFVAPVVNANPYPWDYISALIGWIYFLAWGVSFLPQLYYNVRRWSVEGQSFDFVSLNTVGFMCYSTYNLCFYANEAVQEMYENRYNGASNTVAVNDVVFAVYALTCCLTNGLQIIFFDRGGQTVSLVARVLIGVIFFVILLWTFLIVGGVKTTAFFNYLDLLYGLSMIKLGISIVKYWPQIYLNYKRKTTIGWNIWNVVLDFTGGFLSIAQQLMDSWVTGNWTGMTGNPVKFALGSVSMIYDVVFFVQHFVLYRENNKAFAMPPVLRAEEEEEAVERESTCAVQQPEV